MKRGFTLLEMIIVIALGGLALYLITTIFVSLRSATTVERVARDVSSLIEKAHSQTLAGIDGYQYGVHLETGRAVLYRGSSYNSADPTNEISILDASVMISSIDLVGGGSDILFSKLSGKAGGYGTTTISLVSDTTKFKYVVVTQAGAISVK